MTAVGFEPTQLALVELESTPLDHSGKLSLSLGLALALVYRPRGATWIGRPSSLGPGLTHTQAAAMAKARAKHILEAGLEPAISSLGGRRLIH